MSFRKYVFYIAVLTLPTCLYAQNNYSFHSGFFGGAMLGANVANGSWSGTNTLTATNDLIFPEAIFQAWTPTGDTQQVNFSGRVFGGYQLVSDKLVSAIEIGGNFADDSHFTGQSTNTYNDSSPYALPGFQTITATASTNTKVSLSGNNFYVDIKPGMLVSPNFLIYGRAGLSFLSNLKITDTATWTQTSASSVFPALSDQGIQASASSSNSTMKTGLRLGIGAEYLLTQQISMAIDYTYTTYGSIATHSEAASLGNIFSPTQFSKIFGTDSPSVAVHTQTILFGLNYHF